MNVNSPSAGSTDSVDHALALLDAQFPERLAQVGGKLISYRECGKGPAVVLLHGIGSGAASWLHCALKLAQQARVIAWNAPGYGRSGRLDDPKPSAADYGVRLEQMLDTLGIDACVLVGHSLGAIMAAAYASRHGDKVSRLVLLSPAQGYGSPVKQARAQQVAEERLDTLNTIGVAGMAEHRSGRMLTPDATDEARGWVRWNMRQLDPAGYTQAVHMLCGDDIRKYRPAGVPGAVYCGSADVVTTPDDSAELAKEFGLPFAPIDGAGHACYIEQPAAVAAVIRANMQPT